MLIKDITETSTSVWATFRSSDNWDGTRRPRLVLEVTGIPPTNTPTQAPTATPSPTLTPTPINQYGMVSNGGSIGILRQSPSTSSTVLAYLADETIVYVNSDLNNGWLNITYSGITGYMLSDSVSIGLGTLNYWYSALDNPNNIIGRWDKEAEVYHTDVLSGKPVSSRYSNAVTQWNNAEIACSMTSTEADAEILSYGGTYNQLSQMSQFSSIILVTDYGRTTMPTHLTEGNWYYNNNGTYEAKTGLRLLGTEIKSYSYILIVESEYDEDFPSVFINVAAHEIGHALGWYGHNTESADVMSNGENFPTTLTDRDKNQLIQIYPYSE